jgi:GNAT superfamily N-acetyltransferase
MRRTLAHPHLPCVSSERLPIAISSSQLWSSDVALTPTKIDTPQLSLAPVSEELARAVVAGDLSAVNAAEGWPHEDTVDGLRMALDRGHAPGWFVMLDDVVIGDCGVHGDPDESGEVEIGYGLAAPYRGSGYGSEMVVGISEWLLLQPGVRRVVARTVLEGNIPSRRALERAGFALESADDRYAKYMLARPQG